MRAQTYLFIILFSITHNSHGGNPFNSITLPTTETIISADSYGDDFMVLVGTNGTIIHYNPITGGAQNMPSGVTGNLFNVNVVNRNFAVAGGVNTVLMWNGVEWNEIVNFPNTPNPTFVTPAWSDPQMNMIFYQSVSQPFSFICPYDLSDPANSGLCKGYMNPIVQLCGTAGDIKALLSDGSVARFTNGQLVNNDSSNDALVFEQPVTSSLNITAAYILPESCVPGNFAPAKIFAAHANGNTVEFFMFNGEEWSAMSTGNPGEVISSMKAINTTNVYAVGNGVNQTTGASFGLMYHYDGQAWSTLTLPQGTPAINDVEIISSLSDLINLDGFESIVSQRANRSFSDGLLALFLDGLPGVGTNSTTFQGGQSVFYTQSLSPSINYTDLKIDKKLISHADPFAIDINDVITYQIKIKNMGPNVLHESILSSIYQTNDLEFLNSNCGVTETFKIFTTELIAKVYDLNPGQFSICNISLRVLSIPYLPTGSVGNVLATHVRVSNSFDPQVENNYQTCVLSSNQASTPATNINCNYESIWPY